MVTDRNEIRKLVNKIECDYPVTEWKHNGYHIWPILRIQLYMKLLSRFENIGDSSPSKISDSGINHLAIEVKNTLLTGLKYLFLPKSVSTLYCGAPSHRVNYQDKKYNRYFDPLIDNSNDLSIDYKATSKVGYYRPEQVFLLTNILRWFRIFSTKFRLKSVENPYVNELTSILKEQGYEIDNLVPELNKNISNVDRFVLIWQKILKKVTPLKIFELCYYSPAMLGMNIVAHKMGIETTDMQHGPQGKYHLAYGSWEAVPEGGYEALPNTFNTWDESSARVIKEWASRTTKHIAVQTGNPWVEGWKKGKFEFTEYQWPKNLILYTLQPIGEPLEPYLLETIDKTKDKWNWWLRIHPRQLKDLWQIKEKLDNYGVLEFVNIMDATNLPLPEVLIHTRVHLTKFSGCLIEAFNFGIPTIILDELGEDIFSDYLSSDIIKSCTNRDTNQLIKELYKVETNAS